VTSEMRQLLFAAIFGVLIMVTVIRLSRRGQLSFRYTIGWIILAALGILFGFLIPLITPVAQGFGLSPSAFLGLLALVLVIALTIQLSISISGLQQQVRTLTEELARIRLKFEQQQNENEKQVK